jgi:hypothetical protein
VIPYGDAARGRVCQPLRSLVLDSIFFFFCLFSFALINKTNLGPFSRLTDSSLNRTSRRSVKKHVSRQWEVRWEIQSPSVVSVLLEIDLHDDLISIVEFLLQFQAHLQSFRCPSLFTASVFPHLHSFIILSKNASATAWAF